MRQWRAAPPPLASLLRSPTPPSPAAAAAAGKVAEGLAAYERALALAPRHAEALYNLGVAYTEQGHLDRAIFMCARLARMCCLASPGRLQPCRHASLLTGSAAGRLCQR